MSTASMASRRRFLQWAAVAAGAASLPGSASALDYPTRPVHLVLGFAAGGAPDIVARILGQYLSDRLGQSFVIEDHPGAGTNLATETVARAAPDGYTLLFMALPGSVSSPILYGHPHFDVIRDIAAVASINSNPFVMVVDPSFPAKTVPEFIAYAKANPGKINIASTGPGNLTYLSAELFKMMTGLDMVQVPAPSEGQAQSDIFSGRAQVLFDPVITSLGYVKSGKLRALGLTWAKPLDLLPGVPSIAEFVPGYDVQGFLGIGAPKGTSAAIIGKLNEAIGAALADPQINKRLTDLGSVQVTMTPAEFQKVIVDETAKWAKVIEFSGIKAQ
jgi:tripartite-type tricarboxylate transporter receptor subunit TctC